MSSAGGDHHPRADASTVSSPKWAVRTIRSKAGRASVVANVIDGAPLPTGHLQAWNSVRTAGGAEHAGAPCAGTLYLTIPSPARQSAPGSRLTATDSSRTR